jgi:membrane protein required for beta-lactamase induction
MYKVIEALAAFKVWLRGKKTYIIALLGGLTVVAWLLGWIPTDLAEKLLALLGFGGVLSLRAAVGKLDETR